MAAYINKKEGFTHVSESDNSLQLTPKATHASHSSTTIVRENSEKSTENAKKVEKSSRKSLDVDSEGHELAKEQALLLFRINIWICACKQNMCA